MRFRRVLLVSTMMLLLVGFSGSNGATARDISPECREALQALVTRCSTECGHNFRCFLRCAIVNFPTEVCLD